MSETPLPRREFPVINHLTYLNHASVAPIPRPCADAMTEAVESFMRTGIQADRRFEAHAEKVRGAAAALLGVGPEDVAFVKNTTEGLGFVAGGIDWERGDRVVVPANEFHSALFPFVALRDRGVDVDLIEPDGTGGGVTLEQFAAALGRGRTRLVSLSWVQFARGWRTDLAGLADLCHEHGALLCADVIQGLGLLPTRLADWGVDFATGAAHKWLLGPAGIGLLYVAPHVRRDLRVLEPGWMSIRHRGDYDNPALDLDETARRFEGGTLNLTGIAGLGASIDLIAAAGTEAVWDHVDRLCQRAAERLAAIGATILSDRGPGSRSGIVTFGLDGLHPAEIRERTEAQGFVCAARGGGVRISPHGYNTVEEVDAFGQAVEDLASRR